MCCKKCSMGVGVVLVLLGIGFLLQNLGKWTFWGIEPWTAGFLLAGLCMMGSSCCKDCQGCCGEKGSCETKCCDDSCETKAQAPMTKGKKK